MGNRHLFIAMEKTQEGFLQALVPSAVCPGPVQNYGGRGWWRVSWSSCNPHNPLLLRDQASPCVSLSACMWRAVYTFSLFLQLKWLWIKLAGTDTEKEVISHPPLSFPPSTHLSTLHFIFGCLLIGYLCSDDELLAEKRMDYFIFFADTMQKSYRVRLNISCSL